MQLFSINRSNYLMSWHNIPWFPPKINHTYSICVLELTTAKSTLEMVIRLFGFSNSERTQEKSPVWRSQPQCVALERSLHVCKTKAWKKTANMVGNTSVQDRQWIKRYLVYVTLAEHINIPIFMNVWRHWLLNIGVYW